MIIYFSCIGRIPIILYIALRYAPFGIFSLVASALVKVENLETVVFSMGMFTLAFATCFVLHAFVQMPLLYFIVCRKNPFAYYIHFLDAILAGFAAASR